MNSPLESDDRDDDSPDDLLRGEVIGKVVTKTTLRPAAGPAGRAGDDELASVLRITDPRTEGDAPSIEQVRISMVDAVGTATSPVPRAHDAKARARELVAELGRCGPGDEIAYLESARLLGACGLAELVDGFPGLLWFDRRLPHRRTPRGRDVSPVCSLLVQLGEAAGPAVGALVESADPSVRYYACLVAADLAVARSIGPLATCLFDEDSEVREVARAGLADLAQRREELRLAEPEASALDEAAARVRKKLASPQCTARERVCALLGVHAMRDTLALSLLARHVEWVDRDVSETALDALRLITGEDVGGQAIDWERWIKKHGKKARAEWLAAALGASRVDRRAYAHRELVRVLGSDFGYREDMGPIERILAQRRAMRLARERGLAD